MKVDSSFDPLGQFCKKITKTYNFHANLCLEIWRSHVDETNQNLTRNSKIGVVLYEVKGPVNNLPICD